MIINDCLKNVLLNIHNQGINWKTILFSLVISKILSIRFFCLSLFKIKIFIDNVNG